LVEIYVVPTGSMEDTILTGDMLIGNKFIYGMRTPIWIGIPYTRRGFHIPWFRLPAFKEVESGDVTIFEFPRDPLPFLNFPEIHFRNMLKDVLEWVEILFL